MNELHFNDYFLDVDGVFFRDSLWVIEGTVSYQNRIQFNAAFPGDIRQPLTLLLISKQNSLLTLATLEDCFNVHSDVLQQQNGMYSTLCVRPAVDGGCQIQGGLDYWNFSLAAIQNDTDFEHTVSSVFVFNSLGAPVYQIDVLGGIEWEASGQVANVKAMLLQYSISNAASAPQFEEEFVQFFLGKEYDTVQVLPLTQSSFSQQSILLGSRTVILFIISIILVAFFNFCVLSGSFSLSTR